MIFATGIPLPAGSGDRNMLTLTHRCAGCGMVEKIPRARPGPYMDNSNKATKSRKGGALQRWQRTISTEAKMWFWEPGCGEKKKLPLYQKETPVRMYLTFYMRVVKVKGRWAPCVKPDLDKLARAVLDALEDVVYENDGQVVDLIVRKRYVDLAHPREGVQVSWTTAADDVSTQESLFSGTTAACGS